MQKIYISFSDDDLIWERKISEILRDIGYHVTSSKSPLAPGTNWIGEIAGRVFEADVIIVICSNSSMNSDWAHRELESLIFHVISDQEKMVIPVRIDDARMPGYLMKYLQISLTSTSSRMVIESTLAPIFAQISKSKKKPRRSNSEKKNEKVKNKEVEDKAKIHNDLHLENLRFALKSGRLTLVCGAGVSIGAKVPSWNSLLLELLSAMMKKVSHSQSISSTKLNPEDFHSKLSASSLVIGKYLQSNLGKDFLKELRSALYQENPESCDLIDSIVEVARPQRDGKPLDSIITFNFDALIEENLEKNNVKHKSIFAEGIRNKANELPIYHVHGYLPRTGELSEKNNVVLSEDAYHTQFIDPFSWANLIQLNKLGQNSCLFLGISLTDPNMRRLLDVAKRKDPSSNRNHYIVKKIPRTKIKSSQKDDMLMFLEEQDANDLGLNVLWVEDFNKIPQLVSGLIG